MKTKNIYLLLAIGLLFSCRNKSGVEPGKPWDDPRLTKLERLMLIPTDSVLRYYDLSSDSLGVFPDLSPYTICRLNLSHNRLDTLIAEYLPKEIWQLDLSFNRLKHLYNQPEDTLARFFLPPTLSKLDLSHNQLNGFFLIWSREEAPSLSELNLSNNSLIVIGVSVLPSIRKMDASNNELKGIGINDDNLEYVNISDNPDLSNRVKFNPSNVDTLIHNNIANDKPLEDGSGPPPPLRSSNYRIVPSKQ